MHRLRAVGYFTIMLIGFLLWIAYGATAGILVSMISDVVALFVGATMVMVALLLCRWPSQE